MDLLRVYDRAGHLVGGAGGERENKKSQIFLMTKTWKSDTFTFTTFCLLEVTPGVKPTYKGKEFHSNFEERISRNLWTSF